MHLLDELISQERDHQILSICASILSYGMYIQISKNNGEKMVKRDKFKLIKRLNNVIITIIAALPRFLSPKLCFYIIPQMCDFYL
jgi:hypothetical protein